MPTTPVTPYVPQYITVHLGAPSAAAENVTVSFPEYVKNVASSEIYPTWEPAAIRANILAIISFALNRVYTEYYPSRGYPFNITASTAYDQKFIKGRNIFENISQMVDEIFNSYIRRTGFVEPLAAKFCNGTTTTCDGLSQWCDAVPGEHLPGCRGGWLPYGVHARSRLSPGAADHDLPAVQHGGQEAAGPEHCGHP